MTKDQLCTNYKGYEIRYDEWKNLWSIYQHGELVKILPSLIKAREWINRYRKRKFKQIPVYYSYWGDIVEARVTSIIGEIDSGRRTCWVSFGEEKRRVSANELYAFIPENHGLVKEMSAIKKEIDKLVKRRNELLGKMEILKTPEDQDYE